MRAAAAAARTTLLVPELAGRVVLAVVAREVTRLLLELRVLLIPVVAAVVVEVLIRLLALHITAAQAAPAS